MRNNAMHLLLDSLNSINRPISDFYTKNRILITHCGLFARSALQMTFQMKHWLVLFLVLPLCGLVCAQTKFSVAEQVIGQLMPELLKPEAAKKDLNLCKELHVSREVLTNQLYYETIFATFEAFDKAHAALVGYGCKLVKKPEDALFQKKEQIRKRMTKTIFEQCFVGNLGEKAKQQILRSADSDVAMGITYGWCNEYQKYYDATHQITSRYQVGSQ